MVKKQLIGLVASNVLGKQKTGLLGVRASAGCVYRLLEKGDLMPASARMLYAVYLGRFAETCRNKHTIPIRQPICQYGLPSIVVVVEASMELFRDVWNVLKY